MSAGSDTAAQAATPALQSRGRQRGSTVVNIVGALRVIDPAGAAVIAVRLSPLRNPRDREAAVRQTLREIRGHFRGRDLAGEELRGALIVAEALIRKALNKEAATWRLPRS